MSSTIELLAINLHQVFGNRDPVSRRAAIDASYTDDITFTDPEGTVTGRDAIEAKAAGLLGGVPPEFVFEEATPAYTGGDTGALAWTFGPAGSPVAQGVDIITVRDGRISALHTLLHE